MTSPHRRITAAMNTTAPSFGAWLAAYDGTGTVADLADDFRRDCRVHDLDPATFTRPLDVYYRMVGLLACPEALAAVHEAAALYGAPLPQDGEVTA
jgi:hypothetical protein